MGGGEEEMGIQTENADNSNTQHSIWNNIFDMQYRFSYHREPDLVGRKLPCKVRE